MPGLSQTNSCAYQQKLQPSTAVPQVPPPSHSQAWRAYVSVGTKSLPSIVCPPHRPQLQVLTFVFGGGGCFSSAHSTSNSQVHLQVLQPGPAWIVPNCSSDECWQVPRSCIAQLSPLPSLEQIDGYCWFTGVSSQIPHRISEVILSWPVSVMAQPNVFTPFLDSHW